MKCDLDCDCCEKRWVANWLGAIIIIMMILFFLAAVIMQVPPR